MMSTTEWLVFAFNCFVLGFVVGGIVMRIAKSKIRDTVKAQRGRK